MQLNWQIFIEDFLTFDLKHLRRFLFEAHLYPLDYGGIAYRLYAPVDPVFLVRRV